MSQDLGGADGRPRPTLRRSSRRPARLVATGAAVLLASAALAACGSSGSGSGSGSGSSSGASSTASSNAGDSSTGKLSAAAKAALATAYKGVGADLANLPSVTPKAGVNFYVISCGQSVSSCSAPTEDMMEAAKAAGWSAHMADGKLSPDGFAAAIRQAIAGGAKVIVPIGFDCQAAQAAFKEADNAGITVIGGGGPDDCKPALWKSERLWVKGYTGIQEWNTFGKYGADWAYGQNDGDAKAITLTATTNPWGQWITDGFDAEMKTLGGTVETNIDVTDPETADGSFVQKVTTALLAHPDANILQVPVGGWLNAGLYQAIVSSGRKNLTIVVGGQSDATTLDLIRQGTKNGIKLGATPQAQAWGAWGSVDTAIRVLAGQQPVYIGEQIQAVDATHNMPASGAYEGNVDWKKAFLTSWGKG